MSEYNPVEQLNTLAQPWPLLKEGMDTWFVKILRRCLAFHGHGDQKWLKPANAVDTKFDAALTELVRAFQKEKKIDVDGEVGPSTWGKLAQYEAGAQDPEVEPATDPDAHTNAEAELRSAIISRAEALAAQKIREKQGQNRGEPFDKYNRFAGVPKGSPYCVTLWNYELAQIFLKLGYKIPFQPGASSSKLVALARKHGRLKTAAKAEPGDLIVYRDPDNKPTSHNHTGLIVKVLGGGKFETVEGNTGAGSGVISEGDGIYRRKRNTTVSPADIVDLASMA
ncbi:peptidoglycan-binding protein [bacterium]|nr:peptidoglycan-binding protein [bacterium]